MKKYVSHQTRNIVILLFISIALVEMVFLPLWYTAFTLLPLIPVFMSTVFSSFYGIEEGFIKKQDSGLQIKISEITKIEKYKNFFGSYGIKLYFHKSFPITLYIEEMEEFMLEINKKK